ncbi:MAG: nitrilase family protein [Muribaculaceae bacterium]|nr:nitrilase family protein [Muribaculaceae bacterium]
MEASDLKVCLVPMSIMWGDIESNMLTLQNILNSIHPETDLVILPETFSTGFPTGVSKDDVKGMAEEDNGKTIKFLINLSTIHNVAISGSLIIKDEYGVYNRGFFIEPSGECYFADKVHLFRMGGENEVFNSGDTRLLVRFRGWNISMIICYDLRFPVWCRNVDNQYDLLIVVANWPETRSFVWQTLLTARAIENMAYVCGVNCKGVDEMGNHYDGLSMAIDFKGKNIGVKSDELIYALLKKENLQKFRNKFPAWKDADYFRIENKK